MNWRRWHRASHRHPADGGVRARSRRLDAGRGRAPGRPRAALWGLWLAGISVWVAASLAVNYRRSAPPVRFVVGEIAERNVYSEVPFRYVDSLQTERLRQRAARDVAPVYRLSLPAVESVLQATGGLATALAQRQEGDWARQGLPVADGLDGIEPGALQGLHQALVEASRHRVLQDLVRDALHAGIMDERDIGALREPESAVAQVTFLNDSGGVGRTSTLRIDEIRDPKRAAVAIAAEFAARFADTSDALRGTLEQVLARLLRATVVYSPEMTDKARRQAGAAVDTVMRFVGANEVLVLRGEAVTQDMIDRLEKHQQELHVRQTSELGWVASLQGPLLCAVLIFGAGYLLAVLHPTLFADPRMLGMMALVAILQIGLNRLVAGLYLLNRGSSFFLFPLLPLAFGSMVLAPLAGMRAAVVSGVLTTAVAAWQIRSPESFHLCVMGIAASLVGAALMQRARRRAHLIRTGAAVFVTVLLLELVFSVRGSIPVGALGRAALPLVYFALINAFGTTALVFTVLPLLEYAFGLASDLTLVELSDLNHPLMKRLQLEAPGTYHHSLTVATLAEQAAEVIGANPLMARVCAYFHDIGKLDQPEYFGENAPPGENPHGDLRPRMSSLVILNHVRQGLELARRHKLKRPLREAIEQHHGTSLVYFFYHKARRQAQEGQSVSEGEYRYPGPRPRRKEIVLVSLADSCEAACRSLEHPTAGRIATMVDSIFADRLRSHELDDAELTIQELARVQDAMVRTLATMMHARVPYPKESADEDRPAHAQPAATASATTAVSGPSA